MLLSQLLILQSQLLMLQSQLSGLLLPALIILMHLNGHFLLLDTVLLMTLSMLLML
jgi:hypothetical protein